MMMEAQEGGGNMDSVLSLEVFSYPFLTAFTYSWEERMSPSTPSNVQTVILNFILNILMDLLIATDAHNA